MIANHQSFHAAMENVFLSISGVTERFFVEMNLMKTNVLVRFAVGPADQENVLTVSNGGMFAFHQHKVKRILMTRKYVNKLSNELANFMV